MAHPNPHAAACTPSAGSSPSTAAYLHLGTHGSCTYRPFHLHLAIAVNFNLGATTGHEARPYLSARALLLEAAAACRRYCSIAAYGMSGNCCAYLHPSSWASSAPVRARPALELSLHALAFANEMASNATAPQRSQPAAAADLPGAATVPWRSMADWRMIELLLGWSGLSASFRGRTGL